MSEDLIKKIRLKRGLLKKKKTRCTHLDREHLAYQDPGQQSDSEIRHESGADHEGGRHPGVSDSVQIISVAQVAVDGGSEEAQTGTADRYEGQLAFSQEVDHQHADYGGDQLSDAEKHRSRVFVDRRFQLCEYQDGEGLQGRGAAEGTDEESRAH